MPGNINTQYFQSDVLKPAAVAWAESMSYFQYGSLLDLLDIFPTQWHIHNASDTESM